MVVGMTILKNSVIGIADSLQSDIWDLAWKIGNNPEEGYQEFFASELLTSFLKSKGFMIEKPLAGIETAFLASFKGSLPGPKIAFMAEYDALPDIGHGCGHHLIGAASVGAAAVLSALKELPGELVVIGSPAEETSGAKVALVEKGIFKDINVALMFHPGNCNVSEISSLALDAIEISFFGRAAHMAISETNGINALEAMLIFFQMLDRLKMKLARDERIDGIIANGGSVPNIVPDLTVARFYIRAGTRESLDNIRKRLINCAQKAAEKIGARMSWRFYECSYSEMKSNRMLAECFTRNLNYLGINDTEQAQKMFGSVDMGNVSQVVPSIHPYLRMGKGLEVQHTAVFTRAALSSEGEKVLALAVKVLSMTGFDVLTDSKQLEKIKIEFNNNR